MTEAGLKHLLSPLFVLTKATIQVEIFILSEECRRCESTYQTSKAGLSRPNITSMQDNTSVRSWPSMVFCD